MIEGQRQRRQRRRLGGQPRRPVGRRDAVDAGTERDDPGRPRQARREIGDDARGRERLAVVEIGRRGKEETRRDLMEAGVGGVGAEVRRAGREDRSDGGAGQVEDDGLWHVGDEGRDRVTGPDAVAGQRGRRTCHVATERGPRHDAVGAGFVGRDDRRRAVGCPAAGEERFGVVQRHAVEPARRRHRIVAAGAARLAFVGELALAQQRLPERLGIGDRPGVERGVVVQGPAGGGAGGPPEGAQVGAVGPRRRRRPEPLAHGSGLAPMG